MGNWSGWDIAIVTITALQIIALVALGMQIVRLKGNLSRAVRRGVSFARNGERLLGTAVAAVTDSRTRVENVVEQAGLIREHYARLTDRSATEHLPINWTRFFTAVATVRTARGYLQHAQTLLARVRKQPTPVARAVRPTRRSILERAGLVPPLVLRLQKYLPAVRTAREVYRELQKRGVIGQKL